MPATVRSKMPAIQQCHQVLPVRIIMLLATVQVVSSMKMGGPGSFNPTRLRGGKKNTTNAATTTKVVHNRLRSSSLPMVHVASQESQGLENHKDLRKAMQDALKFKNSAQAFEQTFRVTDHATHDPSKRAVTHKDFLQKHKDYDTSVRSSSLMEEGTDDEDLTDILLDKASSLLDPPINLIAYSLPDEMAASTANGQLPTNSTSSGVSAVVDRASHTLHGLDEAYNSTMQEALVFEISEQARRLTQDSIHALSRQP